MSDEKYPFLEEAPEAEQEVQAEAQQVEPQQAEPAAAVVPTTTEPHEERVPLAALKAEREKRQAYERRIAELEAAQPKQPEPNFYEAPEQYVQQLIQRERMGMQQTLHAALEVQAREQFPDYDEVLATITEYAQENPAVIPQVFNSPNPALAAYKLGKQVRELRAMKDPDQYRKSLEAEIRAKVEAEYAAKEAERQKAAAAIPPDLTAARSARDVEVEQDESLESILAERKRR